MAKNSILSALSDSHLRAIGKVAAQWSALELTMMYCISRITGSTIKQAVILTGSQNVASWCDMLKKLTEDSKPFTGKATELDRICKQIIDIQSERNAVVHTAWHPRVALIGLLGSPTELVRIKSKEQASGVGVPKRGTQVYKDVAYSAPEMIRVAKDIQAAETDLFAWMQKRPKTPPRQSAIRALSEIHPPVKNLGFGG
jgi:hypothetical protein